MLVSKESQVDMKSDKKKSIIIVSPSRFNKKLEKAKANYDKISIEMFPFIPKVKVEEATTEGKWQTTANLLLY